MNGSPQEHAQVKEWAQDWEQHVHLQLQWVDDPGALIRINFDNSGASWSYIGNDATLIPAAYPTMNFGWEIDRGTVLHELGHMLGLGHEHQNPDGGIQWNEEEVIRDLSGPPNYWDEQTIRFNVLDKYSEDQVNGTEFDVESIMLYSFPGSWTLNMPDGTPWNTDLSTIDTAFIFSQYPSPDQPEPTEPEPTEPEPTEPEPTEPEPTEPEPTEPEPDPSVTVLEVIDPTPQEGEILPGETDVYQLTVEDEGRYSIQTSGRTDVTMTILRDGVKIDFDDDSGKRFNAKIERQLVPGVYEVQIKHWDAKKTGKYQISCTKLV